MSSNKFILLPAMKYYKIYNACTPNYIRNIKTGENMGQQVCLKVVFEDENGEILSPPIYEEDCYEYVYVTQ